MFATRSRNLASDSILDVMLVNKDFLPRASTVHDVIDGSRVPNTKRPGHQNGDYHTKASTVNKRFDPFVLLAFFHNGPCLLMIDTEAFISPRMRVSSSRGKIHPSMTQKIQDRRLFGDLDRMMDR